MKGKGRGKKIGYPTINLTIPRNFKEKEGVYAAEVKIKGKIYQGVVHYGPVPTFNEKKKSLEIFLIKVKKKAVERLDKETIRLKLIRRLRDIFRFDSIEKLKKQIEKDIIESKKYF